MSSIPIVRDDGVVVDHVDINGEPRATWHCVIGPCDFKAASFSLKKLELTARAHIVTTHTIREVGWSAVHWETRARRAERKLDEISRLAENWDAIVKANR
jgi:hypothetical protein